LGKGKEGKTPERTEKLDGLFRRACPALHWNLKNRITERRREGGKRGSCGIISGNAKKLGEKTGTGIKGTVCRSGSVGGQQQVDCLYWGKGNKPLEPSGVPVLGNKSKATNHGVFSLSEGEEFRDDQVMKGGEKVQGIGGQTQRHANSSRVLMSGKERGRNLCRQKKSGGGRERVMGAASMPGQRNYDHQERMFNVHPRKNSKERTSILNGEKRAVLNSFPSSPGDCYRKNSLGA